MAATISCTRSGSMASSLSRVWVGGMDATARSARIPRIRVHWHTIDAVLLQTAQRSLQSEGSGSRLLVQREPDRRAHGGDDPEAQDDLRLRPGLQLEVMVDRGHQEDPLAEGLEGEDLQQDRQGRDRAAEPERPGVAHEDRGRERVEPQEAHAGPREAAGYQRQILLLRRER